LDRHRGGIAVLPRGKQRQSRSPWLLARALINRRQEISRAPAR
jgi:hypothetical protein